MVGIYERLNDAIEVWRNTAEQMVSFEGLRTGNKRIGILLDEISTDLVNTD